MIPLGGKINSINIKLAEKIKDIIKTSRLWESEVSTCENEFSIDPDETMVEDLAAELLKELRKICLRKR